MFSKSPERSAEKMAANTRVSRDAIAKRLAVAQGAVTESRAALQRLAVEGADDAALAAGEASLRASQDRVATLTPSLVETEKLLAQIECELTDLADKRTRAATASEVEELAAELIEAAASFDASISIFADVTARAALIVPEANGVSIFATSARTETATAAGVISRLLKEHARLVLAGSVAATLRRPEVLAVPVKVVAPVTTRVFSMKAIHWSTSEGTRFVAKYKQTDLSPAMAAHALKIGACVSMDSVACKTFHGTHVPASGNLADSVSLDADVATETSPPAPEPQHEPVLHTAFERVDRGPSFKLRVAAGGAS